MTDLTEQWKKGELPSGWYYTKLWKGCNVIDKFIGYQFLRYDDSDIVEVLTPVPSYEEWRAKDDALTALLAEYGKLTKELQDEKEKHMTRPSLRSPAGEMVIEKQVWESTFNRSMVLEAGNDKLKTDCKTLAQKLLQVKPELREWLEVNYKEYL